MGSLIAHGSIYQRNIDEKTSLPSSPTPPLCSPPTLFPAPSLDLFNCTVSIVSAAADVSHIGTKLGAEPSQLGSGLPHMFDSLFDC